jgi:hypothetical protein
MGLISTLPVLSFIACLIVAVGAKDNFRESSNSLKRNLQAKNTTSNSTSKRYKLGAYTYTLTTDQQNTLLYGYAFIGGF